MQCGHTVLAGFIFLCHSEAPRGSFLALLRLQASPPEPKSGSYCTIAFNQAVSCWLCTIAETVGLSPAATPGAPFIPVGKDAMTPWIFFSSQPLFYHKSHYVTRFCGRFVVQTPPKRVRKIRFFSILYPRFSNISFHLQKSRFYALIFWFYPLLCKGHLSIFDLCWGDFTTPPSYYIGHLFEIFNHPRGRRGKNALSPPCIGIVALSPPPGAW